MKITAADIGGTYSRFGEFEGHGPDCLHFIREIRLETASAGSFFHLLDIAAGQGTGFDPESCDALVLAVPGAVEQGVQAQLSNVPWPVDIRPLRQKFPAFPVFLINDFIAQAFGCYSLFSSEMIRIKTGSGQPDTGMAVVGAGTGLGCCALIPDCRGGYVAVPSEAAHVPFPFLTDAERDFGRFLCNEKNIHDITLQTVVSGPGLARVHHWLTGCDLAPEAVGPLLTPQSPTTQWFARFYGRVCRIYALAVLPQVLCISGGVAARNPFLADCDIFREEFVDSRAQGSLLKKIPVFLNTSDRTGLRGAALYAILQGRQENAADHHSV